MITVINQDQRSALLTEYPDFNTLNTLFKPLHVPDTQLQQLYTLYIPITRSVVRIFISRVHVPVVHTTHGYMLATDIYPCQSYTLHSHTYAH